jgi:hypothetical protein
VAAELRNCVIAARQEDCHHLRISHRLQGAAETANTSIRFSRGRSASAARGRLPAYRPTGRRVPPPRHRRYPTVRGFLRRQLRPVECRSSRQPQTHNWARTVPHGKNAAVGIDLGLKDGMTLSTGVKVENSRQFTKYQADLAKAQRANKARRCRPSTPRSPTRERIFSTRRRRRSLTPSGLFVSATYRDAGSRRQTASLPQMPARRCLATYCGTKRLRAGQRSLTPPNT